MFKKNLVLAVCLAASMVVPICSIAQEQDGNIVNQHQKLPLEGETLNVVLSVAPPFVTLKDSLTSPSGLEVDIVKELQRRTGFKLANEQYGIMKFSDMISLGMEQKADIMAASISYTESRANTFETSPKYVNANMSIIAHKDSNINSSKDLANKVIAYPAGTSMQELLAQFPGAKGYEVSSIFMAVYAVSRGNADAMFIDSPIAFDYTHNWPEGNLKVVEDVPNTSSDVCMLFKKGSPHNIHLQAAFEDMYADGTLDKIIQKYLGTESSVMQHASN